MVALTYPPFWVVEVTWGPGDGSTSNIAGVQTNNTVETVRMEYRANTAAQALAMAKTQYGRPDFDSATYGTPYLGRA